MALSIPSGSMTAARPLAVADTVTRHSDAYLTGRSAPRRWTAGDARHGVCYRGADSCLLCELAEGILAPDRVWSSRSTSCTNGHHVTGGRGPTANQAGRRRCALPDWGSQGSAQGPRASHSARSRRVPGFGGEEEPERSRRRSASLPLLVASARPVERHGREGHAVTRAFRRFQAACLLRADEGAAASQHVDLQRSPGPGTMAPSPLGISSCPSPLGRLGRFLAATRPGLCLSRASSTPSRLSRSSLIRPP